MCLYFFRPRDCAHYVWVYGFQQGDSATCNQDYGLGAALCDLVWRLVFDAAYILQRKAQIGISEILQLHMKSFKNIQNTEVITTEKLIYNLL